MRVGHLPTAVNLPHKELLAADECLKSPEELAQHFETGGFQRGKPISTHCGGGGCASRAALAAARAWYGPVLTYYLSFGEWAADWPCPVEAASPELPPRQ